MLIFELFMICLPSSMLSSLQFTISYQDLRVSENLLLNEWFFEIDLLFWKKKKKFTFWSSLSSNAYEHEDHFMTTREVIFKKIFLK